LHESVGLALGYAVHAAQVTEKSGEHFDELRDEIAALKRRVSDLEARKQ
jgi:polyhydroxyalkanoate synthesis regulator phasin